MRICIHIACIFGMTLEREAFIPALTNFTSLNKPLDIRAKHIEAIRCMLDVAVREGNFLGESWKDVLSCVSQLELAQGITSTHAAAKKAVKGDLLLETSSQDMVVATDKIFTLSRSLHGDAVVDFVRALCAVSMEELSSNPQAPRKYSLTKTVDISYYNMERVRLEWAHIWQVRVLSRSCSAAGGVEEKMLKEVPLGSLFDGFIGSRDRRVPCVPSCL